MAWFVYIAECSDKSFYTGITWNLKQSVTDHNSGKYKSYTKPRRPIKLVYWERYKTRFDEARKEKVIKGFSRFNKSKLISSLHRANKTNLDNMCS